MSLQHVGSIDGSKKYVGVPDGIRTRVIAVKGRCPRPLDDGDAMKTQEAPRFDLCSFSRLRGLGVPVKGFAANPSSTKNRRLARMSGVDSIAPLELPRSAVR